MSAVQVLYVANDLTLELSGLHDRISGLFLNDATVTATLLDASGAPLDGTNWPKTLDYVADSDGVYRLTLSAALGLSANASYTARVSAVDGSGVSGQWDIPCVARARRP